MEDVLSVSRQTDPINEVVGANHFIDHHKFPGLHVDMAIGRSPRLRVSRYYWDLEEPLAIDFVREIKYGEAEIAAKKEYCSQRNIRYIIIRDAWDSEGTAAAVDALRPEGSEVQAIQNAAKPLIGPRRRK